jgi:hypothetical protein
MRLFATGGALLAAVLLAPALARASEAEFGGPLPEFEFAAFRPLAAPPPPGIPFLTPEEGLGAPAAVVALAPLLGDLRTTRAAFRAGGATVRVYGERSRNKGNWFIVFAADGGDAQFRDGRKMIHWAMLKRTVHFSIGGKSFSSYIQGNISNRMQSRLVVSADDRSQPDSSWSIQEITDDGFAAGAPVALGGREYRLFYARDFDENGDGDFAGYTGGRSIVLVARDRGGFTGYHWLESDVPRGGALAVAQKPAFSDRDDAASLPLALSLTPDGRLAIYDRSAAPARR